MKFFLVDGRKRAIQEKRQKKHGKNTIFRAISGGNTDESILNWPFSLSSTV